MHHTTEPVVLPLPRYQDPQRNIAILNAHKAYFGVEVIPHPDTGAALRLTRAKPRAKHSMRRGATQ